MHLWSVFLVQNPQIFRGPAAPRPRLQRCLRRLPPPRILISTELVTMHLTAYATSLNAYSHSRAPISHPTPPQSRAKGKATISRGVEPADHKGEYVHACRSCACRCNYLARMASVASALFTQQLQLSARQRLDSMRSLLSGIAGW